MSSRIVPGHSEPLSLGIPTASLPGLAGDRELALTAEGAAQRWVRSGTYVWSCHGLVDT
jgi:hypothetical protein